MSDSVSERLSGPGRSAVMDKSSPFSHAVAALLNALSDQHYRFTTVTPATHERVLRRREGKTAQSLRDAFGWNLPFERGLVQTQLHDQLDNANVIENCGKLWVSNVRIASFYDKLLAHSAFPTGQADAVFFGPDTYRFVSAISRRLKSGRGVKRAVDIGCGTGAAGISVALKRPDAQVILADINDRALQFATINAAAAIATNVSVQHSDVLEQLDGEFDFIVANPPYMVDAAKRAYRDGGCAHGTELSLRILRSSLERTSVDGAGLLYTGAPVIDGVDLFQVEAQELLRKSGVRWTYEEVDPDVFGEELEQASYGDVERIAAVVIEFEKGM